MPDFIYLLKDPETGEPRYIGKTSTPNRRLAEHICQAGKAHNKFRRVQWIRSLLARGLLPALEIVMTVPDGDDWQTNERELIAKYRAAGSRLTNSTDGGDGLVGVPKESRARAGKASRERLSIPENLEKHSAALKAAWADPVKRKSRLLKLHNPAVRQKISDARRATWADPDARARIVAGLKRNAADPAYRQKLSVAVAAARGTQEARAAQSKAMKRRWADDSYREVRRASFKGVSEGTRKKLSEASKASVAKPGERERMSERTRKNWANPASREKRLAALRLANKSPESRKKKSESAKIAWSRRKESKSGGETTCLSYAPSRV